MPKLHTKAERTAIAKRFKQFRKNHGLLQIHLAKLLDMERTGISDIETGKRYPYYRTLQVFCELESKKVVEPPNVEGWS